MADTLCRGQLTTTYESPNRHSVIDHVGDFSSKMTSSYDVGDVYLIIELTLGRHPSGVFHERPFLIVYNMIEGCSRIYSPANPSEKNT